MTQNNIYLSNLQISIISVRGGLFRILYSVICTVTYKDIRSIIKVGQMNQNEEIGHIRM